MTRAFATILIAAAISGCTQFPQVDAAMNARTYDTAFPSLAPTEDVVSDPAAPRLDADSAEALARRAAWLRLRAERLRNQDVLDGSARDTLQNATSAQGG